MQKAGFINYYHGSSLWSFSKRGVSGPRLLGGLLVLVLKYTLRSTRVFDLDVFEVVDCSKYHEFSKFRDTDI